MGDATHPMVPPKVPVSRSSTGLPPLEGSKEVADRLDLYEELRLERTSKVQALARDDAHTFEWNAWASALLSNMCGRTVRVSSRPSFTRMNALVV
jgi:hypothetical protein